MTKFRPINIRGKAFYYEMIGYPCPICRGYGWCAISKDKKKVICMKMLDDTKRTVMGGSLYYLDKDQSILENFSNQNFNKGEKHQPNNIHHKVYTLLSEVFGLSNEHKDHLMKERGLSEETIKLRGYFSTDRQTLLKQIVGKSTMWEDLFEKNGIPRKSWKGIAGFFLDEKQNCPVFQVKSGIAIPCRNEFGQIVGSQIRLDNEELKYSIKYNDIRLKEKIFANLKYIKEEQKIKYSIKSCSDYQQIAVGKCKLGEVVQVVFKGYEFSFTIKSEGKYVFTSSINKKYGTSVRSLVHFSFTDRILQQAKFDSEGRGLTNLLDFLPKKSVILTEGLLKGDIISSKIDKTILSKLNSDLVLCLTGVNTWNKGNKIIKNYKINRVFSAWDIDFKENDNVYNNMVRMFNDFYSNNNNLEVYLMTWTSGKGLDDCLLLNGEGEIVITKYLK